MTISLVIGKKNITIMSDHAITYILYDFHSPWTKSFKISSNICHKYQHWQLTEYNFRLLYQLTCCTSNAKPYATSTNSYGSQNVIIIWHTSYHVVQAISNYATIISCWLDIRQHATLWKQIYIIFYSVIRIGTFFFEGQRT